MRRAVVLAGGGYAASAWELGLITGMADAGLDVRHADRFVGTSAGARVALHLASGVAHEDAYRRRLEPNAPSSEPRPVVDWVALRDGLARARHAGGTPAEILRRVGSLAVAAAAGQRGASRRAIVAAQLPVATWPERDVRIATVNADTGERRVFDRHSGIDLVDAVIATTASFGSPPALFQGAPYFDGGYYSSDNADLATGCDRVLILALERPPGVPFPPLVSLEDGVQTLQAEGAVVEVLRPDAATRAALAAAGGVMHPEISAPAARAGRVQGRSLVNDRIWSFWQ
jgi:NTE family protein